MSTKKPILIILLMLSAFSLTPVGAVIITDDHGGTEQGRIGEISKDGFQFHGERFLFLEFKEISDIAPEPGLRGDAAVLDQEKELVPPA